MIFFTIGVYNSTEKGFFTKLTSNGIDTFCDIRQRRGVRGAKYAFVNSKQLQCRLSELDIAYMHELKLAPTKEIRELQMNADKQQNQLKRYRSQLSSVFIENYKHLIINNFDFGSFVDALSKAKRVALFCVEEKPEACHRSVVTDKLSDLGYSIEHL